MKTNEHQGHFLLEKQICARVCSSWFLFCVRVYSLLVLSVIFQQKNMPENG